MIILENRELCNGCHACYSGCPKNCIEMEQDREGFLFPKIDDSKCNECGICQKICPMNKTQIERMEEVEHPKSFAVTHKNEEIILSSSSGGAFSLFAEYIINEGGVVFGARFNENWEVIHDYTETIEGLGAFRLSKNVQSRIGDNYKKVKNFLLDNKGRIVLFCGCPCQIGCLKSYLQKDYENLICVDFICRGVPSPKVFQKYNEYREKVSSAKIKEIKFRVKNNDFWQAGYVLYVFANGERYYKTKKDDLYKRADAKGLTSRLSCFKCGFKTINRISDLTIADFWGVEYVAPEAYDSRGVSLVLVQSPKGQEIFDRVKSGANCTEVDFNKVYIRNSMAFRSRPEQKNRNEFMKHIDKYSIEKL